MSAPTPLPADRLPDRPANREGAIRHVRKMPDMRVVTKGWWTLREERVPLEALQQEDRDEGKSKR